jgi:predicted murein hydrolase (TIGR00659 family)
MKFEAANLHAIASQGAIFWLPYTLALYAGAVFLFRRSNKHPALNPTLLTIAGVAIALFLVDVEYARYFESVSVLNYLLGTAVVALAIPLHRNLVRMKGRACSMAAALILGSLVSILAGLAVAVVAGASTSTLLSLAPKSATAAVSIEIARLIGGMPAVTAVLTILTGITGAVVGPTILALAGVRAPEARGFALGVASHGIATARAFAEGEVAGSFAGLGMALNAVLTALLVPPIMRALGFH